MHNMSYIDKKEENIYIHSESLIFQSYALPRSLFTYSIMCKVLLLFFQTLCI